MAGKDLRSFDRRDDVLRHPFWIDSKMFDFNMAAYEIVLFSFPAAYGEKQYIIHECCCEVITAWTGTNVVLDVGSGTVALDATVEGATVTTVDADEYIPQGSITQGTAGYYWPAAGDWLTAAAAMTGAARLITCADATVPVVYVTVGGSAHTAGQAVVHMLVSVVPFSMD